MLRPLVARARAAVESARLTPVSRRVRDEHLTYLGPARLRTLESCASEVNRRGVTGDFVEAGVALGGSAIVLATLMGPGRSFHGFDAFGMIPPPGPDDPPDAHDRYATIASGQSSGIDGELYYGYRPDLHAQVVAAFQRFDQPVDGRRIALHRGLFQDALHPTGPVALAHVDSDWYDPVKVCLERLAPCLSPGGYVVLDDYFDYGGCRRAVDEFLAADDAFAIARSGATVALQRAG